MSNGLTFAILHIYNFTKFLPMLAHALEMSCTKFHENRMIIDGEIDEKHALQIIVSQTIIMI